MIFRLCRLAALLIPLAFTGGLSAQENTPPTPPAGTGKHAVTGDRLNVRGQPSFKGETIIQLRKDETVMVIERIPVAKPKKGEPSEWAKILLPDNTPVWVSSLFIDEASKTVKPAKLNVRSGPGENFSAIGLLKKGDAIRELRRQGQWIEIEPEAEAFGFVASQFLAPAPEEVPVKPAPETTVAKPADPAPLTPPAETVAVATPPVTPVPTDPVATDPVVSPEVRPDAAPPEESKEKARRIVQREGFVVRTLSIQAPTPYGLKNSETGEVVNYLLPSSENFNMKHWHTFKVTVRGEELIDKRWTNTPVLRVDYIMFAP
jgi:hypothetical protein